MNNENMKRSTFACANYIIENLYKRNIDDLTNLKLQKLLYFAYGVHLSLFNEKLFEGEIQAWKHGPVVPVVYHEFKDCGKDPIMPNSRARIEINYDEEKFEEPMIDKNNDENRAKSLFVAYASYGDKNAWELVEMLHNGEEAAWKKHFDESKRGKTIPDEDILIEFEKRIDEMATLILG
jgi:uncharacterized phage-associated protein